MKEIEFNEKDKIEDYLARFDRVKTLEEIEKEKEEKKKEILSKGFLPKNDELLESMTSPMEDVEMNPRTYIIEECIPACEELWRKNIYTYMVSNHLNEGVCWIEVYFDNLSDENKDIFNTLEGEDITKFSYHQGCVNFGVKCVGEKAQRRLLELAKQFKMQDVPYKDAYINLTDYLINCGCYKEVKNPNYIEMSEPWEMNLSVEELKDYITKYDEWRYSDKSIETYKVFDESKVTKPLEKYFEGTNYIYDGERVYLSSYHYQKHMNYEKYLEETQDSNHKM